MLSRRGTWLSLPRTPVHDLTLACPLPAIATDLTLAEFVTMMMAYGKESGRPEAFDQKVLESIYRTIEPAEPGELELPGFVQYIAAGGRLKLSPEIMLRAADSPSAVPHAKPALR